MHYRTDKKVVPVLAIVLDGWGIATPGPGNAITLARKPNYDWLMANAPHTELLASGEAVGLVDDVNGNSEVGHMNLGAGRVVPQDLVIVNEAIKDGSFFKNAVLLEAMRHVKRNHSALHLLGMISRGGVHSWLPHLFALLEMAKREGIEKVYIHAITDGRDAPTQSALEAVNEINQRCEKLGIGRIVSVFGRFYAMDRVDQWERSAKVYRTMVFGHHATTDHAADVLNSAYEEGRTDEFIAPTALVEGDEKPVVVKDNDALIFWHLRSDRARQLTKSFVQRDFTGFNRGPMLRNLRFIAFTDFGSDLQVETAFPTTPIQNTLPAYLSKVPHLTQAYLAESEKFPHISYFFHGSSNTRLPNEDVMNIPSPVVMSYQATPEMSAGRLTEIVLDDLLHAGDLRHDFYLVNFANADAVGHTGNLAGTIRAVEFLDQQLGRIVEAIKRVGGTIVITADHGNAEMMLNPKSGTPDTAHSTNSVPLIVYSTDPLFAPKQITLAKQGVLADFAPTVLELLGLPKPSEMSGVSLIVPKHE